VTCLRGNLPGTRNKNNNISMATSMEFNKIPCLEETTKQEYLLERRSTSVSLVLRGEYNNHNFNRSKYN
jgi:hypothetical protein